jgi:Tfp pilus assembly protein PilF
MLEKAHLLLQQGRYRDAEKEIAQALAAEPENDEAHALLARLKIDSGHAADALAPINEAIRLEPTSYYYFYLRAFAHYRLDQNLAATSDLDQSLQLYPYAAGTYGLYAYVLIDDKKFEAALAKANEGLQIDGTDELCLNARSMALNKLGRVNEAIDTMRYSLANEPDSDFTHATVGWNYLEKGQHKTSIDHFREALRINPESETAKAGLKEALKSKIPPYRWLLMYSMWLANQGRGVQIGMTIGLYIAFRMVGGVLAKLPVPFNYIGIGLVVLYLLMVVSSWILNPIANLILSFHPEGRYAISRSERLIGQLVGASLVSAVGLWVWSLLWHASPFSQHALLPAAICMAIATFALAQLELPIHLKTASNRTRIAAIMALAGVLIAAAQLLSLPAADACYVVLVVLAVALTWVNALARR